jgi:hypothetical protein
MSRSRVQYLDELRSDQYYHQQGGTPVSSWRCCRYEVLSLLRYPHRVTDLVYNVTINISRPRLNIIFQSFIFIINLSFY